jgi:uncharacterized protein
MHDALRIILIITGSIFVGLGILGIILPLLPTTPFLLLGAACYFKGSPRFYSWLINNKWLGIYIKSYREGKGIPKKTKIIAISSLWITIGWSIIFMTSVLFIRVFLFLIASGVTYHILSIKTLKSLDEKGKESTIENEQKEEIAAEKEV